MTSLSLVSPTARPVSARGLATFLSTTVLCVPLSVFLKVTLALVLWSSWRSSAVTSYEPSSVILEVLSYLWPPPASCQCFAGLVGWMVRSDSTCSKTVVEHALPASTGCAFLSTSVISCVMRPESVTVFTTAPMPDGSAAADGMLRFTVLTVVPRIVRRFSTTWFASCFSSRFVTVLS